MPTTLRRGGTHKMAIANVDDLTAPCWRRPRWHPMRAFAIDDDVQFGVTRALVAPYVRHEPGGDVPPPAADVGGPWYTLAHRFVLQAGEPKLPPPPVTGKAAGARPELTRLQRRPHPASPGGA